jgi:peptide methionine sulfoxide reductase msrA/msrB
MSMMKLFRPGFRICALILFALEFIMSATPVSAQQNVTSNTATRHETAVFASGCFWGTEYMFQKEPGVINTTVGYTGGFVDHPTYQQVCSGKTGHAEALKVEFDPQKTSYEKLARLFFETHDPTQVNGQGPDIGEQYRSVIFYKDDSQKATAEKLIGELKSKGIKVATQVVAASTFWPAENYHQDYYKNNGKKPYCHSYKKLF